MIKLLLPVLLLVLASGACNKSDTAARKNFAGTYVGTTHRLNYHSQHPSAPYEEIYPDSVIVTTWDDSIRFRGMRTMMDSSGGLILNRATIDTGLFHYFYIASALRYHEYCQYLLSDGSDSLSAYYECHHSGPTGEYSRDEVTFVGIRR